MIYDHVVVIFPVCCILDSIFLLFSLKYIIIKHFKTVYFKKTYSFFFILACFVTEKLMFCVIYVSPYKYITYFISNKHTFK